MTALEWFGYLAATAFGVLIIGAASALVWLGWMILRGWLVTNDESAQ